MSGVQQSRSQAMVQPVSAMRSPYLVVDDFLPAPIAYGMRANIDKHFSAPNQQGGEAHQIWNYWYVPEMYTYLRAQPGKIIEETFLEQFRARLGRWAADTLGMGHVSGAWLSMYVPGCRQNIHNDSLNGRFAYVYSLTRNERKTFGGETIVFHEGDPFRMKLDKASAGRGFFDLVPPLFNRLVVFDDRMPHGVERIDGSMDPREGRFVMHGHIREAGPIVRGGLAAAAVSETVNQALDEVLMAASDRLTLCHGPLALRLWIERSGTVERCEVILDRVAQAVSKGDPPDIGWPALVENMVKAVRELRFGPAPLPTVATIPLLFGGEFPTRPRRSGNG